MKPLVHFWNDEYGVARPLEADSWSRRLWNKYLVAALMNNFPNTATRIFSRSRGELARLLFVAREGGSYRVLRAMYEFEDRGRRGDLINRLLMQSPAVKAARNRRRIAQRMLQFCLRTVPAGQPTLVLAIGGGDGSLEAEAIAQSGRQDVYYCGLDRDPRAVGENQEVLRRFGLERRGFTCPGNAAQTGDLHAVLQTAGRRFGVQFDGIGITVCQGIAEYLDIGCPGNETFERLLTSIYESTRDDGTLLISQTDHHDRVKYLENGLSWHMRLRDSRELAAEVEKTGWRIAVCEMEPMKLITMCLAARSEVGYLRLERNSPLRPRHAAQLARSTVNRL